MVLLLRNDLSLTFTIILSTGRLVLSYEDLDNMKRVTPERTVSMRFLSNTTFGIACLSFLVNSLSFVINGYLHPNTSKKEG